MGRWEDYNWGEPYVGKKIDKVNNMSLPKEYVDFMKLHNGGEGDIGNAYLVLFPLEELQEINEDYAIEEELPGHIIIGNNGSGELYGINSNGEYFNVPFIIEKEYLTILGSTLDEFYDGVNALWEADNGVGNNG